MQVTGAAWFMTMLTSSNTMVALVQTAFSLPFILFSLLGGAMADRHDRRRIMLNTKLLALATSLLFLLSMLTSNISPVLLICFTFFIGTGVTLYSPAWQASVGNLVAREILPSAIFLNNGGNNLNRSTGPILYGIITSYLSAFVPFILAVLANIFSIYTISTWKKRQPRETCASRNLLEDIKGGVQYLLNSSSIRNINIRAFIFGFGASSFGALAPSFAKDILQGDAMVFGLILCCFGAGALISSVLFGHLFDRLAISNILNASYLAYATGIFIMYSTDALIFACLGALICGVCWIFLFGSINISVQLLSRGGFVGRMLSIFHMSTFAGVACGSVTWGMAAGAYSIEQSAFMSSLVLIVGVLLGRLLPVARINMKCET